MSQTVADYRGQANIRTDRRPLADAIRRSHIEWIGVRRSGVGRRRPSQLTGRLAVCAGTTAERVQTGVEGEYRIGLGQIADCSGHRLRMDAILTSRRIGLIV
jgi:hypothetical protein